MDLDFIVLVTFLHKGAIFNSFKVHFLLLVLEHRAGSGMYYGRILKGFYFELVSFLSFPELFLKSTKLESFKAYTL